MVDLPIEESVLSRRNNKSETHLPLTTRDSSSRPHNGHVYERMQDPQQQQRYQGRGGRRSFDDDDENDDGHTADPVEENTISALEQRETGVEMRSILTRRTEEVQ